jgi:hypothetical protein
MNQLWIVAVVLVALLVFTRLRSRRRLAERQHPPASGPRVQGHQVRAFVHARMGTACLYDNGMQFGRGFRRKEGPALPHDALCRCEAVPFSFTSSEVFNGALRNLAGTRGDIAGLDPAEGTRLIERLKTVETAPLPADANEYVAAVGLDAFAPGVRPALRDALRERHAFLHRQPGKSAERAGGLTSNGMETA